DDGGSTWTAEGDTLAVLQGHRVIAVTFTTATLLNTGQVSNEVVVAATDNGLYQSNDCGITWALVSGGGSGLSNSVIMSSVIVDPTINTRFYAGIPGLFNATGSGITIGTLNTTTGGISWVAAPLPSDTSAPNDADPPNATPQQLAQFEFNNAYSILLT